MPEQRTSVSSQNGECDANQSTHRSRADCGMIGSRALLFSFSLVCCAAIGGCLLARALVSVSTLPICWLTTCACLAGRVAATSGGGRILAERDGSAATGDGDAWAVVQREGQHRRLRHRHGDACRCERVGAAAAAASADAAPASAGARRAWQPCVRLPLRWSDRCAHLRARSLLRLGLLGCSALLALELSPAYLHALHEMRADVRPQSLHEIGDRRVKWKAGRARGYGGGSCCWIGGGWRGGRGRSVSSVVVCCESRHDCLCSCRWRSRNESALHCDCRCATCLSLACLSVS